MNNKQFWDKTAPRYAKDKIKDLISYQRKLKTTQAYLSRDMTALEVGCGTGMTAIAHAAFVKHYHATDISPVMIDLAKNRAEESQITNVSFEVNELTNLTTQDERYDAVLALSVLHLLENAEGGIHKINKLVKPGGLFISSTICLGDKMNYLKAIIPIMRRFGLAPAKVNFLKKAALMDIITANDFTILHEWQPSQTKAAFIIARKLA